MNDIQIPQAKTILAFNDIGNADANVVAASFLVWLGMENGGGIKSDMRYSYVKCLTARNICFELLDSAYDEKYNLYNCRGCQAVNAVLFPLEQTKGFEVTQRSKGGSGVYQASFNKYREFWKFLEEGGPINSGDVLAEMAFIHTLQLEKAPDDLQVQEVFDKGIPLKDKIVEQVKETRFIVPLTLSKLLRPEIFVGVKHPTAARVTKCFIKEVEEALQELCEMSNAQIGKLDQQDAQKFGLSEDVYYSTEWMIQQMATNETLTVAGIIGLSIYEELQDLSVELYKETGDPESTLKYPGSTAWIANRNHQNVIVPGDFPRFISVFMRIKTPYAFRLAEELKTDQTIPEKKRKKVIAKMFEHLAMCYGYEPARQKLQMLK